MLSEVAGERGWAGAWGWDGLEVVANKAAATDVAAAVGGDVGVSVGVGFVAGMVAVAVGAGELPDQAPNASADAITRI